MVLISVTGSWRLWKTEPRVSTVIALFVFCMPICDVKILPNDPADYTPSVPFSSEVGYTSLWSVLEGLQVVLNNVFSLPGAVDIVAVENEHQHWPERLTFWCETPRLFIK